MRSRLPQIGATIVAAMTIAAGGCGDGSQPSEPASLVPPDALLYAEAVLRPEADQREAIESFVGRVAGIEDPGGALIDRIDSSLAEQPGDFTYGDDIEPWLGDRGAVFVRSFERRAMQPDAAGIVQVTDTEAAQDFIDRAAEADPQGADEERSYEGVDYLYDDDGVAVGLVDDALVLGTEESFKVAVDASSGESLAEADEYTARTESLDDGALASVYLRPGPVIEAAIAAEDVDPADARLADPLLAGPLSEPITITLAATADSATLDLAAAVGGAPDATLEPALLEGLPAGSWLALAAPDLGPLLQHALDQLAGSNVAGASAIERRIRAATGIDLEADIAPWLGDVAGFVRGTASPGLAAGVVAETSDPEGPRKVVELLQLLAERDSGLRSAAPPEGADYGFSLGIPGLGAGAEVGVIDGRLAAVLGASLAQVVEPDQTLASDERFQAAVERLGDEVAPAFFLSVPEAFELAQLGADADSPDYAAAGPYVEAFESFVAGGRIEDGLLFSRLTLTLAE